MKHYFLLCLLALIDFQAAGAPSNNQTPVTASQANSHESDKESPHVVDLDHRLTIAPFFDTPGTNLSLNYSAKAAAAASGNSQSTEKTTERKLNFSHKLIHTFGTSITYGNLGWAFKYQPPYNKEPDPKKGKTEHYDVRGTYALKNLIVDTFYQRYQGFYILQYEESGEKKQVPTSEVIRPNLRINNFGLITTYVFKGETFAPRAVFDFSKKQARMGHSPLLSVSYLDSDIRDDEMLIPESIGQDFGAFSEINNIRMHTLTVAGGYGITAVAKDFLFHASGQLGAGGSKGRYNQGDSTKNKLLYSVVMDLRLAVGYNTERYFSGLNYIWHTTNTVMGDLNLLRGAFSATIIGGMRW